MHKAVAVVLMLLGSLIAYDNTAHNAIHVEVLAKSTKSWNQSPLPSYPTTQPEITILRISIAAGTALPMHQHPLINAGVMLRGILTVVTERNETLHLSAGDALVEVTSQWHYGINEGNETAELIVFYAGTPGLALSISK